MAIQDSGFEYALNGIKTGATHAILYGYTSTFEVINFLDQNDALVKKTITWNNPSLEGTGWELKQNASSPIVFEITQVILDSYPDSEFNVRGVKVIDASDNVILEKAFPDDYKFDVPGELTIDEIKITASN